MSDLESTRAGWGRILGFVSMSLSMTITLLMIEGYTIVGNAAYWFFGLILAIVLGLAALIVSGRGNEYGIIGIAVGFKAILLLLLGFFSL